MNIHRRVARHRRLTAWAVLAVVFIGLVLIVTLGRQLDVWQYVGLSVVAVVVAGLSVALTFDDTDRTESTD